MSKINFVSSNFTFFEIPKIASWMWLYYTMEQLFSVQWLLYLQKTFLKKFAWSKLKWKCLSLLFVCYQEQAAENWFVVVQMCCLCGRVVLNLSHLSRYFDNSLTVCSYCFLPLFIQNFHNKQTSVAKWVREMLSKMRKREVGISVWTLL